MWNHKRAKCILPSFKDHHATWINKQDNMIQQKNKLSF